MSFTFPLSDIYRKGTKDQYFESPDGLWLRLISFCVLLGSIVGSLLTSHLVFAALLTSFAAPSAFEWFRLLTFYRPLALDERRQLNCTVGALASSLVIFTWFYPDVGGWLSLLCVPAYRMLHRHLTSNQLTIRQIVIICALCGGGPLALPVAMVRQPSGTMHLLEFAAFVAGSDGGGWLFGKTLGNHGYFSWVPVIGPRITRFLTDHPLDDSPSKTWAGLIGCVLLPATAGWYFGGWSGVILGAIMGGIAQWGDILASQAKRAQSFKNFAFAIFRWLRGMGGVNDRTDSVMTTAPAYYLFLQLTPHLPSLPAILDAAWKFM